MGMVVLEGHEGTKRCHERQVHELRRSSIKIRLGWSIRITEFPIFQKEDTKFHDTLESIICIESVRSF